MPRIAESLHIPRWAANGMRQDPDDSNDSNAVNSREEGLDQSYSQVGGKRPDYRMFNQIFFELTSFCEYVNRVGLPLPWSGAIDYMHTEDVRAFVKGTDGKIYVSVKASGPGSSYSIDPVNDTAETRWKVY